MADELGSVLWKAMKNASAVWEYPYQKGFLAPHLVLRSGKHSDRFVDALQYLSVVSNLTQAARLLAEKLKRRLLDTEIDWVVGSPMAGIPLATIIAPMLGAKRVGFNEKIGGSKELVCRFNLSPGENFLMVEEMTTTGGTPQRGIEAVLKKNPDADPLPFVGAFLIRCDNYPPDLGGRELVSLVSLPDLGVRYNEWNPLDCPLCKNGSPLIENCKQVWSALLRTMEDPTYPLEPAC